LRLCRTLWYILNMREWMREQMRRRSKRGPNNSESTGKIGQELPQNQPAPLQPNYAGAGYQPRGEDADAGPRDTRETGRRESGRERSQSPTPVIGSDLDEVGRTSDAAADGSTDESSEDRAGRGDRGGSGRGDSGRSDSGRRDSRRSDAREPGAGHASGRQSAERQSAERQSAERHAQARAGGESPERSPASTAASEASEGKLVVETQPESPSLPPPEVVGSPRPSRGFVVLTIGLPGSGKTTWFKRRGVTPLSSDMLRSILFDDIGEQRYQGLVFSTLRSLLRARLIAKMPWNYVDATNLSPHERRQWIKMAKSFGYDVQAVFFDVPFEVCMERNRRRERTLSDEAMQKMAERLRPPSFKEGFSKITLVRVKGQPAPTPESAMSAPVPADDVAADEGDDDTSGFLEGEEV
jgi:predicted kinase